MLHDDWQPGRKASLLAAILMLVFDSQGQQHAAAAARVVEKLRNYIAATHTENMYLQPDRDSYEPGDTLYFKAYVTGSERPVLSSVSGVLDVDLLSPSGEAEQAIRLRLDSGVAWGDFALPPSSVPGNYTLGAFTRWMLNDSAHAFYERSFSIGAVPDARLNPNPDTLGVMGKMPGNGFFVERGTQQNINLPSPGDSGIHLALQRESDRALTVSITANTAYYQLHHDQPYFLIVYSGGKATIVDCLMDAPAVTFDLQNQWFSPGVANLGLFSPEGELVSQRLFFVQPADSLQLYLQANHDCYRKGDKIAMQFQAKGADGKGVPAHFSISVVREDTAHLQEKPARSILSDLLLSSAIDGPVVQPDYYVTNPSAQAMADLDKQMITHRFRRFSWRQVLDTLVPARHYEAEKGLSIQGMVVTQTGKPLAHAQVQLIATQGGPVLSTHTDEQGKFSFSNLVFFDSTQFVLRASDAKGRSTGSIRYFSEVDPDDSIPEAPLADTRSSNSTIANANNHSRHFKSAALRNPGHTMDTVQVRAKAVPPAPESQNLAGHADQVMRADEIEQVGGLLSTSLNGRLRGIGFIFDGATQGVPYLQAPQGFELSPMLVVMDGVEMNPSNGHGVPPFNIDEIPSSQVESVEVLRFASASIYGMGGANGVLIITTKKDIRHPVSRDPGLLPITPVGFYQPRMFDPLQRSHSSGNRTIYWNPEFKTDQEGKASLDWNATDKAGTYRIIIEGIDADGHIGRLIYRYCVAD